ncbi:MULTISPECIES: hypothetical protein [Leptospira]|uniref:Uncharacterized protein n=1 Tax=Leptospira kirschneri serovar Pomona TaxID=561005 RepID=A0A1T1DI98_9LEPT|nr:hypothetical protein [Leptospira sp. ZV016]KXZ28771.1 hypothetical protein AYB32_12580 [Leptospira kirschneri]KXZ33560.1 hypothetical protein AYB34_11755 [Leptospira sp. ZV016]OOV40601.1 hypothetical protein B1J93_16045 [Leptospira kirschneri serovar Pomona]
MMKKIRERIQTDFFSYSFYKGVYMQMTLYIQFNLKKDFYEVYSLIICILKIFYSGKLLLFQ